MVTDYSFSRVMKTARKNSAVISRLLGIAATFMLVLLSGCSTYYSHYASFAAENSAGKERQFVIEWQSSQPSLLSFGDSDSTPVVLRTECSERELVLRDADLEGCDPRQIASCATPGQDLDARGLPAAANVVCATLTDRERHTRIGDLSNEVMLQIHCFPAFTEAKKGKETINVDYLKASSVPYTLQVKRARLHSLEDRPPVLSTRNCEAE